MFAKLPVLQLPERDGHVLIAIAWQMQLAGQSFGNYLYSKFLMKAVTAQYGHIHL